MKSNAFLSFLCDIKVVQLVLILSLKVCFVTNSTGFVVSKRKHT